MGGFEGGDEGGFWDEDSISTVIKNQKNHQNKNKKKSYIQTSDGIYSTEDLCNIISFVPCKCDSFTIEGCDDISLESNGIYKAYKALLEFTNDSDIEDFFSEYKVLVTKGSTNTLAFMSLLKEVCNLIVSKEELEKIERTIG